MQYLESSHRNPLTTMSRQGLSNLYRLGDARCVGNHHPAGMHDTGEMWNDLPGLGEIQHGTVESSGGRNVDTEIRVANEDIEPCCCLVAEE